MDNSVVYLISDNTMLEWTSWIHTPEIPRDDPQQKIDVSEYNAFCNQFSGNLSYSE